MQEQSTATSNYTTVRLNLVALAVAFGAAGVVEVLLFGVVMGATWGMMGGGGGMMSGGWMHGSASGGPGYGGGSMMGGSLGFVVYALFWGFLGGAIAGGVTAWVYNSVIARNA